MLIRTVKTLILSTLGTLAIYQPALTQGLPVKIWDDFQVNETDSSLAIKYPSITVDRSGNSIIAWNDRVDGSDSIFVKRLDSNGNQIGPLIPVGATSSGRRHDVAVDSSGNFTVVWVNSWNVYTRQYSATGDTIGGIFPVFDISNHNGDSPVIAMNSAGDFVIAWIHTMYNNMHTIYARRFDNAGNPVSGYFQVNEQSGVHQEDPAIAISDSGNFVVAWTDDRNDWYPQTTGKDIYLQRYNSAGDTLGMNFKVTDDTVDVDQSNPSIEYGNDGSILIAWDDGRRYGANYERPGVHGQVIDVAGGMLDSNFIVFEQNTTTSYPSIALNDSGKILLVAYSSSGNIIAREFNPDFSAVDSSFIVNSYNQNISLVKYPVCAISDNRLIFTWRTHHPGVNFSNVYATAFLSGTNTTNYPPSITLIPEVSFSEDQVLTLPMMWLYDYATDWNDLASDLNWSFHHNDHVNFIIETDSLTISADDDWFGIDTVIIIIDDGEYSDSTDWIITVTAANDAPQTFTLLTPVAGDTIHLTSDNLNEVLTFSWEVAADPDNDTVRYFSFFSAELNDLGFEGIDTNSIDLEYNILNSLMNQAGTAFLEGYWSISATDGIDTVMATNGPFSLAIDASLLRLADNGQIPENYSLEQNYPNPFNPTTTISYELPQRSDVLLTIYDLLGKEVTTLVSETQEAGFKSVKWDATNFASGVYIYQIVAGGFVQNRKMVLLK